MDTPITGPISPTAPQQVNNARLLREGSRALVEATILPRQVPGFLLGEEIQARVAERLPDNQVAALVKNALFTLKLPEGARVEGNTLALRVSSLEPRLTFQLLDHLGKDAQPAEGSVSVDFSRATRYLMDLLSSARQPRPGAAETLLPDPKAPLAEREAALQHAVGKSGVFYEAHQKAWAEGRMPLERLHEEPQAKLGQALQQALESPRPREQAEPLTAGLGNLLQRQLDTLEQRSFVFNGLAWPNQTVEWQISREDVEEREGDGSMEAVPWSTRLSLQLPQLGGLTARLRVQGGQVQVLLDTERPDVARLVDEHRQRLVANMEAAGLTLTQLRVDAHEV